jgi:apolipoprotein D and lipocalin family protein
MRTLTLLLLTLMTYGCSTTAHKPLPPVDYVDLERFMGDWYVIANITTFIEKGAHNALEQYELAEDGTILTTFTFRKDGFDGEQKRYTPRGFVRDTESNAVWGMQFIWPIKADFRIVYLDEGYTQTVIGRNKRDYVWIMARTPSIPEEDLQAIIAYLGEQGYDVNEIQRVPQRWDEAAGTP